MTDVISTKIKNTTHEKFAKLLKLSNNNESIQFDKKTVIEFDKDDWEILNQEFCGEQEFNNTSEEDIILYLETIYEKDGISHYYCFDFTIDNFHALAKTQKELEKISEEIKKAEHYIEEAYKLLYNPPSNLEDENKNIFSALEFRELGILALARIYDNHEQAVSLPNILKRIELNFVEKWLKVPKYKLEENNLDKSLIVPDQKKISKSNDAVSKLFKQRDKSIAHLDRAYVFRLLTSKEQKRLGFPVQSEVEELITIAKELCDRYSRAINLPLDER